MTGSRNTVVGVVVVAIVLAAASVLTFAAAGDAFDHGRDGQAAASCVVPPLPGTVSGDRQLGLQTRDAEGIILAPE